MNKPFFKKWWLWVVIIFLVIPLIIAIFVTKETTQQPQTLTGEDITPPPAKEQTIEDIKSIISASIASAEAGADKIKDKSNAEIILDLEALQSNYNANMQYQGKDPSTDKLLEKQKTLISNTLKKYYPTAREKWIESVREKMWEQNIEMQLSGKRKDILIFTAGIYANNAEKAATQKQLTEMLVRYRMKETGYKWFKYDENGTYYTINSPSDDAIIQK